MNMNVSGWGGQRPSVAGMSILRNRVSKTSFGTQVEQAREEAKPAAEQKCQATLNAMLNAANEVEEPFTRKELTKEELAEFVAGLSKKYNPRKMTQEDYDSFLDDLMAEGLLSKDEVKALGYHGLVVMDAKYALTEDGKMCCYGASTYDTENPDWKTYVSQYGYPSSLRDTNGDALAYAMAMSLQRASSGTAGFIDFNEKRQNSYAIMAGVLKAMDPGGSVQGAGKDARSGYDFGDWDFENKDFDVQGMMDSAIDSLLAAVDKSVERAHAEVERAVQADLERSGYIKFEDRMIPLNIL